MNECVFSCRADYATRDYVIGMLHVKLTKCSGFLRQNTVYYYGYLFLCTVNIYDCHRFCFVRLKKIYWEIDSDLKDYFNAENYF